MDRALSLTEYSGTLKPKTSRGIGTFARIIERKTHGYLRAAFAGNRTVSVAMIPWCFTYLCWNIPICSQMASLRSTAPTGLTCWYSPRDRLRDIAILGPREALDELLVQGSAGEDEPVPAKTAAYKLTLLKKLSQSTRPWLNSNKGTKCDIESPRRGCSLEVQLCNLRYLTLAASLTASFALRPGDRSESS